MDIRLQNAGSADKHSKDTQILCENAYDPEFA